MTEVRVKALGEIAFEHSQRFGKPESDGIVYGVDKSVGLTCEPRYQSKNLSRYKVIQHGMFAYNPMRLNIGSIGFCSKKHRVGIVSPDYVVFGCDENYVIPEFLDYHTKTQEWKKWIALAGHGSVRERIYFKNLAQYQLRVPSLHHQEATVRVLSTLDDKIELNQRMNETLEAMAQAMFRDWFVDFGPVRRRLAGATDPVAIMGGLTPDPTRAAELAALFPDALGDDDLPVGWNEKPLDQIADFLNGLALQKFPARPGEPSLPVIKIAELRGGLTEKSNRAAPDLPERYIIRDGDFLFSWSGSLMAKVWTEGEGALNQHLFKVSSAKYPQWFYARWVHHHMPEFQSIAASKATTMGHIQRGHLSSAMTVCPPDKLLNEMSKVMDPLWQRAIHNDLENRNLAETRDYLLPRLMSGEVRVGDGALEIAA